MAVDDLRHMQRWRTATDRSRRRARWRARIMWLLELCILLGAWGASLQLVAGPYDPYGVGRMAVAQFRQQYPLGLPLTVRIAETNVGWIGVCEGVAWLHRQSVAPETLRPDGTLFRAAPGTGNGLWLVDAEVVTHGPSALQAGLGQLASAPPPPWRQLLPLGVGHPLIGSWH